MDSKIRGRSCFFLELIRGRFKPEGKHLRGKKVQGWRGGDEATGGDIQ
jgi:hypothetical protein